jgi:hypothetical protein
MLCIFLVGCGPRLYRAMKSRLQIEQAEGKIPVFNNKSARNPYEEIGKSERGNAIRNTLPCIIEIFNICKNPIENKGLPNQFIGAMIYS